MYQKQEIPTSPLVNEGTRDYATRGGIVHAGGYCHGLPYGQLST